MRRERRRGHVEGWVPKAVRVAARAVEGETVSLEDVRARIELEDLERCLAEVVVTDGDQALSVIVHLAGVVEHPTVVALVGDAAEEVHFVAAEWVLSRFERESKGEPQDRARDRESVEPARLARHRA
jgi:hypothetical protein